MPKSMTGYGRGQIVSEGRELTVEIRSVNHRFYEFSARVPRSCGFLEEKLKGFLQGYMARGKVEVYVNISTIEGSDTQVEVNEALAAEYTAALRTLKKSCHVKDDLSLSALARLPDIFVVRRRAVDENALWAQTEQAAAAAAEAFRAMRAAEGERLRADIEGRLTAIAGMVAQVDERSPQVVEQYRARLAARLAEVLSSAGVDENRILAEAAVFADKTAVAEETVRLNSHIQAFRGLLALEEPIGKKLDFLVQEMNREANTIGSKGQDTDIAYLVIEIKSEIEKIREQIQNIE